MYIFVRDAWNRKRCILFLRGRACVRRCVWEKAKRARERARAILKFQPYWTKFGIWSWKCKSIRNRSFVFATFSCRKIAFTANARIKGHPTYGLQRRLLGPHLSALCCVSSCGRNFGVGNRKEKKVNGEKKSVFGVKQKSNISPNTRSWSSSSRSGRGFASAITLFSPCIRECACALWFTEQCRSGGRVFFTTAGRVRNG